MTVGNRGYDTMALSGERKPCLRGMRPSEVRVSLSLFRYIERIAMVLIGTVLMSRIFFSYSSYTKKSGFPITRSISDYQLFFNFILQQSDIV